MKAFTHEVKMRFEAVQGDERVSSHSGLALVDTMLDKTDIQERLGRVVLLKHLYPEITHGDLVIAPKLVPKVMSVLSTIPIRRRKEAASD